MSLLFFLILAVSAILAVVFYKKDEEAADGLQKRTLITFTIAFVSLILFVNSFGDSSDNKKNTESKASSSKQVKTSESSSSESRESQSNSSSQSDGMISSSLQQQINEALLKNLTEDQGFALGKLAPNGQPLPDGQTREPNSSFN